MQKAIEIRLLCEVVVLSAIYCNPPLTLNLLEQIRFPDSPEAITEQFFSRLLEDAEHFEGYRRRMCARKHMHTHECASVYTLCLGRLLEFSFEASVRKALELQSCGCLYNIIRVFEM